jgi:hypothetical protein
MCAFDRLVVVRLNWRALEYSSDYEAGAAACDKCKRAPDNKAKAWDIENTLVKKAE